MYRINVGTWNGSTFGSTWTPKTAATVPLDITIANLSETSHARKFLSGPSVVQGAQFNQVLIGSGDREHPLRTNYPCASSTFVTNAFYMIKDTPPNYPATVRTPSSLVDVTTASCPTEIDNGWYFHLPNACEQVVNKATSIGGYTYFGTNQPAPVVEGSCSTNLGIARGYAVTINSGCAPKDSSRSITFTGGGLPPSPVAGIVDVDGKKITFCLGCGTDAKNRAGIGAGTGESFVGGGEVQVTPPGNRTRTFWFKN